MTTAVGYVAPLCDLTRMLTNSTKLHDLVIPGKPLRYSANPPRAVSTLPANRRRLRSRRRVIFLVLNEGRFESFPRPKVRRADFSQAGSVPIRSRARRRPARLHRSRYGDDVGRFGIDVERRRLVLHQGQDLLGVRRGPAGTTVAAAGAVIH